MGIIIAGIIGYLIGCAVTWYVCEPIKSFNDGYNAAKEFYHDFERGFNAGWDMSADRINEKIDIYCRSNYGIGIDDVLIIQACSKRNIQPEE